jgi:predicted nucleotidyltransferase
MAEVAEKIDKIIKEYLSDVSKHVRIDKAYVYGSYASGRHDRQSDLDIAIFSDSFKDYSFVDAVTLLLSLARKYRDICIDPVAFTVSDLQDGSPFIKGILATGKEITELKEHHTELRHP